MKSVNFTNRVVIVTGGGMGLGKAYCEAFADEGAAVVCPDVNVEAASEVAEGIKGKGGKALALRCDVTRSEDIARLVETTTKAFGRIDALVNNVGFMFRAGLLDTTEELWDKLLSINLKSVFLVSRAVAPTMIRQKGGKILNVSSLIALSGIVSTAYTAAKAGIIGMTRYLALELAPHRINVNCLAPGFVRTPATGPLHSGPIGKRINDMVPLGVASPEQVAPVAVFLCSSGADYITGQCIVADGGFTSTRNVGEDFMKMDVHKLAE